MSVPIAIATNTFRVVATGYLAQYYGTAAAEGFFHEFAGMVVFLVAMVMMGTIAAILKRVGQ